MAREADGELWSHAPSDWIDIQEGFSVPLWRTMLQSTEVDSGTRLLDAGCGGGGACLLAEELGAEVTGLDASEGMIARASQRVPGGTFVHGDLGSLPFEDGRFDAVIAASSMQYADSPERAAKELRRVTRPGGKVALGLFSTPDKVEYRAILDALAGASPDGGIPFSLSAPGALQDLLEGAGLEVVETGEVDCPFTFADTKTLWSGVAAAGPGRAAILRRGRSAVRRAVEAAASPYRRSDGTILFDVVFQFATGLCPEDE